MIDEAIINQLQITIGGLGSRGEALAGKVCKVMHELHRKGCCPDLVNELRQGLDTWRTDPRDCHYGDAWNPDRTYTCSLRDDGKCEPRECPMATKEELK